MMWDLNLLDIFDCWILDRSSHRLSNFLVRLCLFSPKCISIFAFLNQVFFAKCTFKRLNLFWNEVMKHFIFFLYRRHCFPNFLPREMLKLMAKVILGKKCNRIRETFFSKLSFAFFKGAFTHSNFKLHLWIVSRIWTIT